MSMEGRSVIRSYRATKRMEKDLCDIQNDNTRVYFSYACTGRWLGIRLDLLSALFFSTVVLLCVAFQHQMALKPSTMGLMISYLLQLVGLLQWTVRQSGEVENLMVSTERALEYTTLKPENNQGNIKVPANCLIKERLFLYPGSERLTLKNINVNIPAGSKVGIVGRTGAGKSSIINALFRISEPLVPGSILIDGINTSDIALDTLRSRIAIIPQEPFCFKGSFRFNLDPFGDYTDEKIWKVLEMVELFSTISKMDKGLDSEMSENGGNLSVGQRQLICLARAILKNSKVIVMDEATSSVDINTDQLLHDIIDNSLSNSTIITIAHRLQTIIEYDLLFVLENGFLVESGSPFELITKDVNQDDSYFAKLVNALDSDTKKDLIDGVIRKMKK